MTSCTCESSIILGPNDPPDTKCWCKLNYLHFIKENVVFNMNHNWTSLLMIYYWIPITECVSLAHHFYFHIHSVSRETQSTLDISVICFLLRAFLCMKSIHIFNSK